MERLKETPIIGNLLQLLDQYPRLSAWAVLSTGIVALLIYEARDVDLTTTNWIALIVASILVSGLCIWIVSWEDDEELAEEAAAVSSDSPAQAETATPEPESASESASGDT